MEEETCIYANPCGFFKRNRPSDHVERQPLNGRDEHL